MDAAEETWRGDGGQREEGGTDEGSGGGAMLVTAERTSNQPTNPRKQTYERSALLPLV